MNRTIRLFMTVLTLLTGITSGYAQESESLNLADFGSRWAWESADAEPARTTSWNPVLQTVKGIGVVWDEERDVDEIRLQLKEPGNAPPLTVQYWFKEWPHDPPEMPTIEDKLDDIWQGKWLNATVLSEQKGSTLRITFAPLEESENARAANLPGVTYRRTMKIRLLFGSDVPPIADVEVRSPSRLKPMAFRVELGVDESAAKYSGSLEIYNGYLDSVEPWNAAATNRKPGLVARARVTDPSPAGSNDITVITVRSQAETERGTEPRTFSFSARDLERGPIYVPDFHAYVTRAEDEQPFTPERYTAQRIREQIPAEPEQTYERARREIPPQDPWRRQYGDKVYLPVAADSSWQKFAVEYGGNFFLSKNGTKAKGKERERLQWEGDRLRFSIGTGEKPYYREDQNARVSVAEEDLPIVRTRWKDGGIEWEEEALATLLSGPLDPNDPARSEQTPAVLMARVAAYNPGVEYKTSRLWLTVSPEETLRAEGSHVYAVAGAKGEYATPRLRAVIQSWEGSTLHAASAPDSDAATHACTSFVLAPNETRTFVVKIPFVSDVNRAEAAAMESLRYGPERERVAAYWRTLIEKTTRFETPEPEFNHLARFVVPHIHIGATKDPKSGLSMVPAASYHYQVYANESCFQTLALDALGDNERAGQYLETLLQLQGTRSFPGNYTEPHDGVFHGAKVDEEYDYTASNYGLDHGTVLWALARHYLFTRDVDWLRRVLPNLEKAVEWIERQRALTKQTDAEGQRELPYGLLPAGHLEDNDDWGYWLSVNAYCAAGMRETARAMRDIRHPRAEEMTQRAEAYLQDLRTAVRRMTELAPVTRMRDGTFAPYVPTKLFQRFRYFGPLRVEYFSRYDRPDVRPCFRLSATREVLYGPMILLNLGIFDVSEPIADWILDDWEDNLTLSSSGGFNVHGFTDDAYWFSQGGMVFQSNLQNPVLVYLMRNETEAAVRGLYNNFVSCLYPDVNTLTEEYRMWSHASGPFYKSPDEARFVNRLRDALAMESGEDLWLASGAPRRWWTAREGIRVDRIQTEFGPVAYRTEARPEEKAIVVRVEPPTRNEPKNLWLYARLPKELRLQSVAINGQPWNEIDAERERIRLPQIQENLEVLIRYEPVTEQ